ncbi:MAG: electron transfer flavoprotein subunit beta/FixA family protein [Bacteroidia bacterium]|nr:electron transfer flavoprotein subunit beta/FixA family protein [Bacteroidia bacterium]MDW8015226.1 electron transfer flavoprotein subunit beta/FixA family protein [Bacteroidia bacterium]
MKILCCISHVPDTTTRIQFTADGKALDRSGVTFIINPYDDFVLARAAELKEKNPTGVHVTVLCVGKNGASSTDSVDANLRKALALGLDEAVRIDAEPLDAFFVASQIAAYAQDKGFDLFLFGKESIDYNGSQVPGMVAALLGLPFISYATSIEILNGSAKLTREITGGKELIESPLPLVLSAQKGLAEWRIPNVRGIMQAKSKPLHVIAPLSVSPRVQTLRHEPPPPKGTFKKIEPERIDELVQELANKGLI